MSSRSEPALHAGGSIAAPGDRIAPPTAAKSPLLAVTGVCKRFDDIVAVDGLSFAQEAGEILALLGPNGAGKTTLVRMLVGITRPDAGAITFRWDGNAWGSPPRQQLGYLPEERGLYADRRVDETLEYLAALRGVKRSLARQQIREWLARTGLAAHAGALVGALSKGNQQKVQLIAALLHAPRFAVLDEPFSGLDPINQQLTLDLIRRMREEGTTVLLCAHQMELVERIADRVVLMCRGRLLLAGTLDELRGSPGPSARPLHDVYVDAVGSAVAGGVP